MSVEEWREVWKAEGKPEDGGIVCKMWSPHRWVVRTDWLVNGPRPLCHHFNHSRVPNAKMVNVGGVVAWVAVRPIGVGQEVTFRYEDVPAEWNETQNHYEV